MDALDQSQINQIKQAAGGQDLENFTITAGSGILVNGGKNNWGISSDDAYIQSLINNTLKKYTVQICVNGSPKSLDVYAASQPY